MGMRMKKKSSSSTSISSVLWWLMAVMVQLAGSVDGLRRREVPAMYVLGDSTLDVGNNNYLAGQNVFRANRPYYGIDYPTSSPTGRFSNGYNIADFIAKKLGFRESPPAYLSLQQGGNNVSLLVTKALTRGVSFASAGAGILDSTFAGRCIPLSTQVDYFKSTRAAMAAKVGSRAVSALLASSFFLVGVGSNDMFAFANAQQQADVAAFYGALVGNYSAAITGLYAMGARKFAVINVGLVGCVPQLRVLSATAACNDGLNRLAAGFDEALSSLLSGLAARLPGFSYSIADSHTLTKVTFADPQASGYTSIEEACCGSGRLRAEGDCQVGSMLCADRDPLLFWDRVHPSQRANMLSAQAFYDGPAQFTKPINFDQLARTTA